MRPYENNEQQYSMFKRPPGCTCTDYDLAEGILASQNKNSCFVHRSKSTAYMERNRTRQCDIYEPDSLNSEMLDERRRSSTNRRSAQFRQSTDYGMNGSRSAGMVERGNWGGNPQSESLDEIRCTCEEERLKRKCEEEKKKRCCCIYKKRELKKLCPDECLDDIIINCNCVKQAKKEAKRKAAKKCKCKAKKSKDACCCSKKNDDDCDSDSSCSLEDEKCNKCCCKADKKKSKDCKSTSKKDKKCCCDEKKKNKVKCDKDSDSDSSCDCIERKKAKKLEKCCKLLSENKKSTSRKGKECCCDEKKKNKVECDNDSDSESDASACTIEYKSCDCKSKTKADKKKEKEEKKEKEKKRKEKEKKEKEKQKQRDKAKECHCEEKNEKKASKEKKKAEKEAKKEAKKREKECIKKCKSKTKIKTPCCCDELDKNSCGDEDEYGSCCSFEATNNERNCKNRSSTRSNKDNYCCGDKHDRSKRYCNCTHCRNKRENRNKSPCCRSICSKSAGYCSDEEYFSANSQRSKCDHRCNVKHSHCSRSKSKCAFDCEQERQSCCGDTMLESELDDDCNSTKSNKSSKSNKSAKNREKSKSKSKICCHFENQTCEEKCNEQLEKCKSKHKQCGCKSNALNRLAAPKKQGVCCKFQKTQCMDQCKEQMKACKSAIKSKCSDKSGCYPSNKRSNSVANKKSKFALTKKQSGDRSKSQENFCCPAKQTHSCHVCDETNSKSSNTSVGQKCCHQNDKKSKSQTKCCHIENKGSKTSLREKFCHDDRNSKSLSKCRSNEKCCIRSRQALSDREKCCSHGANSKSRANMKSSSKSGTCCQTGRMHAGEIENDDALCLKIKDMIYKHKQEIEANSQLSTKKSLFKQPDERLKIISATLGSPLRDEVFTPHIICESSMQTESVDFQYPHGKEKFIHFQQNENKYDESSDKSTKSKKKERFSFNPKKLLKRLKPKSVEEHMKQSKKEDRKSSKVRMQEKIESWLETPQREFRKVDNSSSHVSKIKRENHELNTQTASALKILKVNIEEVSPNDRTNSKEQNNKHDTVVSQTKELPEEMGSKKTDNASKEISNISRHTPESNTHSLNIKKLENKTDGNENAEKPAKISRQKEEEPISQKKDILENAEKPAKILRQKEEEPISQKKDSLENAENPTKIKQRVELPISQNKDSLEHAEKPTKIKQIVQLPISPKKDILENAENPTKIIKQRELEPVSPKNDSSEYVEYPTKTIKKRVDLSVSKDNESIENAEKSTNIIKQSVQLPISQNNDVNPAKIKERVEKSTSQKNSEEINCKKTEDTLGFSKANMKENRDSGGENGMYTKKQKDVPNNNDTFQINRSENFKSDTARIENHPKDSEAFYDSKQPNRSTKNSNEQGSRAQSKPDRKEGGERSKEVFKSQNQEEVIDKKRKPFTIDQINFKDDSKRFLIEKFLQSVPEDSLNDAQSVHQIYKSKNTEQEPLEKSTKRKNDHEDYSISFSDDQTLVSNNYPDMSKYRQESPKELVSGCSRKNKTKLKSLSNGHKTNRNNEIMIPRHIKIKRNALEPKKIKKSESETVGIACSRKIVRKSKIKTKLFEKYDSEDLPMNKETSALEKAAEKNIKSKETQNFAIKSKIRLKSKVTGKSHNFS